MDSMQQLARIALDELPPATRFRPEDAETVLRHRELLLSWEPGVVQGFYDTLYGHPPTATVFREGERPDREGTLSNWWRRTVEGPLDDDYFAWMAMVGLVHVLRGVTNPMMLAMASYVVTAVESGAVAAGLPPAEGDRLATAFRRLASTVGAIITFGYDRAVSSALYNIAGMPDGLLRRLRDHEVAEALSLARAQLRATGG